MSRPEPMQISEHQLSSMTRELDTMHNESFPGVRRALDEFTANLVSVVRGRPTRRGILLGAAGAAGLGALAACGSDDDGGGGGGTGSTVGSSYLGDLRVVALAAALENLAVAAYDGASIRATDGKLGTVPPAIVTFVQTARKQHADHAAAWNGVLGKAGLPTITDTPLTIAPQAVADLEKTTSVPEVMKLALGLEDAAAQTYTFAAANVTDAGGIMVAATIQPVETMHAAILNFVLGQYPVPATFITVDKAVKPDALTK